MVVDMSDFEYQKENIVPLPQGRSATILSALYAKDSNANKTDEDSDSLTGKELRDIKRREFENELKDIDEVDDPLNTYFSYISWLQDNYPSGNDVETGLLTILETVLKKYQGDPRYLNDGRYLRLWFLYAHYSQEPIEIFKFLSVNDIGQNLSTYYEEYALYMETQNKYKEANEIYTLGINRKAQPIERLKKRYIEFQKRMILSVNKPADDIDSPKHEHVKSNLLNMKSRNQTKRIPLQVKHVSSAATQFSDQNHNPNIGHSNNNNTSFTIFEDKMNSVTDIKDELFGSHNDHQNSKEIFPSSEPQKITREGSLVLPTADQTNEWTELGSHHLRRKENIKELESWNNVTLPQKASLIASRLSYGNHQSPVSFKIYEDPIEPEYSSPRLKTPSKQVNMPKDSVIRNINSNDKPKNVEVHRCLMNMIYSLSINNLYKEIIKEKERILVRKHAGLRNERMNENLRKLDEKTFNKIKKNIDWSYDPDKNNYYNSFECKKVSEFSIEEIRARYYKNGYIEVKEEKEKKIQQQQQHHHHQSNENIVIDVDTYHSSKHSHSFFSSTTTPISNSVTNLSSHKKNKSISHSPSLTDSMSSTKSNSIISSYVHGDNPMEIHSHYLSSVDNKENEEDEETRYTVKQDLKIFMPHDLSSEKQHTTPTIPRTRLHVTAKTSNSIKKHSTSRSPLHHISHSKTSSHKITHLTPESARISHHHYHHYSSSSTLSTSSKSNHSNSISAGTVVYEPHTPTPQKLSRFSTNSSTLTNSNTHLSLSTTTDSESNIDPFARHESFHCKNSPTVTINTKNAFETVYSWFNEPCDNEAMDNLYIDNNQTNSDIDNTFILKDRQNRQKKHSP